MEVQINRMEQEICRIKTLLKLVVSADIHNNPELKQFILTNQGQFTFLS